MQVRIFTIPFNSNLGIFDDGALNDFSKDKEIVGINDYLFTRNEIPYLTLVVKYNQTVLPLTPTSLSSSTLYKLLRLTQRSMFQLK